jgi:hypothetical protein
MICHTVRVAKDRYLSREQEDSQEEKYPQSSKGREPHTWAFRAPYHDTNKYAQQR